MFRVLTSASKERVVRVGQGGVRVALSLLAFKFRGFIPQPEDTFLLLIRAGGRKVESPVSTLA
jgi:hypothetical protein